MSIKTTSGWRAGNSSTASRPSAHSATISKPSAGERMRQTRADDGLVVDEGGADHGQRESSTGIRQVTSQPPGVGPAENSPPSAVARSCIPISP